MSTIWVWEAHLERKLHVLQPQHRTKAKRNCKKWSNLEKLKFIYAKVLQSLFQDYWKGCHSFKDEFKGS